jgi:hypothetical protein
MNDRKEINEIKEGLKGLIDRLDKLENTIPLPLASFNFFQVDLPEDGEKLYFIRDLYGTVSSKIFNINTMSDIKRFENGLYFETEEEAEQHLKEQRLLFKIKKWAEIHNEGWKPDWSDYSNNKYLIYYDGEDEVLRLNAGTVSNTISTLPFFKTREIAQACIELFGDEIIEVLC